MVAFNDGECFAEEVGLMESLGLFCLDAVLFVSFRHVLG